MPSMGKVLHLHYFQCFTHQHFFFFFFFFCLIVLVWTSSTLSNRWVREDILVLFLILGEKHSVFYIQSLSMILAVGFLQMLFIRWGSSLLFLVYWMFLSWIGDVFCQVLFCVCWDDHVVFVIGHSIDVVYDTLIAFPGINQTWIPGINPTWLWYVILFIYLLLIFLLRILVHKSHWSIEFFPQLYWSIIGK